MLPAIGAASLALDTIQSLTSPQQASSQPIGGGFDLDGSSNPASAGSGPVSGFGGTQISSDNLNALIDAQSLASGDLASALGSGNSDSSQSSASGTASSTYNAINQLAQTTAIPVGLSVNA